MKIEYTDEFIKSLDKLTSNNLILLLQRKVKNLFYDIKWFFQRKIRGYDDPDIFDMDRHLTKFILPRIKEFRKMIETNCSGVPTLILEYNEKGKAKYSTDEGMKRWISILKKIELAFILMHEENNGEDVYLKKSVEEISEDYKKIEEGLELFGKYYQCLWD